MAIQAGEKMRSSDVMKAIGSVWNDSMQGIFNADLQGFTSSFFTGSANLDNVLYQLDTNYTTSDGYSNYKKFSGDEPYDFSGTTVDPAYWTLTTAATGSYVTQGSGYLYVHAGGGVTGSVESVTTAAKSTGSTGSTAIEITSGSYIINAYLAVQQGSDVDGGSAKIALIQGTTSAELYTLNPEGQGTDATAELLYRLNVDKSGQTAYFGSNLTSTAATGISLTGLASTGSWYLYLQANGMNDVSTQTERINSGVTLRQFYNIAGTGSTEHIVSLGTASENITNIMLLANQQTVGGASGSYQVSVDGGSTYEAINPLENTFLNHTGSNVKVKATLINATNGFARLYESAVKYNLAQ